VKPVEGAIAADAGSRAPERGRLFRKYFLLILGLVCGALLLSGSIGLYFSYQENKVALLSLQREKAVGAAARIEQFIRQIEQQLAFSALPQLGAAGVEQRRIEFLKLLRLVPAVTDIAWIDARGREQLAVSRLAMDVAGADKDRSRDPAFLNARPGQTWFGPVYFRKETEPYLSIAVRAGGEAGAVSVADVNLKFIWDVVSRIKIGRTGKAYVVDGAGQLVADPDIGLVLRKTDLSSLPQVRRALAEGAEESLALVSQSRTGESVLTAYASIESLRWKVFVEQPTAEVFQALSATVYRTVALIVAGLLISALAALWLARSMTRPIRVLQEGAARIGAGDLEQKIDVRTGDELQALAEQFNRMSTQLRESYAGLERKVEERTAELRETLEQQTATAGILQVISSSVANAQPVFEKIVSSCQRLFLVGQVGIILVREDGMIDIGAHLGPGDDLRRLFPMPLKGTSTALCIEERRIMHWPDVFGAPGVPESIVRSARLSGTKSLLMAPMLWEGRGVGSIYVGRQQKGAFSEKEMGLLKTFADQAVIAVQNARLFRDIQDKGRQLEIANQHKSEFLANMSHELRTPLNAIIGFSEVLIEKMFGEVNEKQLDYLNDIHSSGRHLLSLINDILDLSKIEAGRMELDVSEFDLRAALANAMTLVKERAQRNGVELALEADPALGAFRADERKFKQIMLNLLSNAVKFTPSGGKVTVSARAAGGGLEVAVADTGVGIAPEDQSLVFEEFRQVGRDYTKKAEGTGLGLALVRKFVELHGGTIRLESEPGKGSTFTFNLPERA
jgi:signal transduction histidine kinase